MNPKDGAARRLARRPWALAVGLGLQACSGGEDGVPTPAGQGADAQQTDASATNAPPSYLAAESVIRTSCAFVRCHGGPTLGGAGLWFDATRSVRGPLVNVRACEYDKMMRVKPGDVANSWVMKKLTSPQDPETHEIAFSPESDWVPNLGCNLPQNDAGGRFGLRMPETTFQLDADSLAKLVAWIEAGAPGPD